MFKLKSKETIGDKVRGIFSSPIQYENRLGSKKWTDYFGKYQNQKWGVWDSDSCWALSAINCVEDQMEYLWKNKMFSKEAQDFFTKNGYIDSDGDFSLSERYLEILSGVHDQGNNQMEAGRLMQIYGCIPRSDLTYTQNQANQWHTKEGFNADYFNINAITMDMRNKGQKFLTYVNIARQWIGKGWVTPEPMLLIACLKQAPLQIGIPCTADNWNATFVKYNGVRTANHAVELYDIDATGNYQIFDQYLPNLKTLSKDYYIPMVSQIIVTATPQMSPNPYPQVMWWNKFWTAVNQWYNGISNPFPIG